MCKEIDEFADELSSEERTKAAAMLLKMGCKAKDTVNPPTTEVMGFPPLLWVAAF